MYYSEAVVVFTYKGRHCRTLGLFVDTAATFGRCGNKNAVCRSSKHISTLCIVACKILQIFSIVVSLTLTYLFIVFITHARVIAEQRLMSAVNE